MSVMTSRGGIPHVVRETFDASGRKVRLPFFIHYLVVRNLGGTAAKLYFTEADFTADKNYVTIQIPSPTYPYGEWTGPVETAMSDHTDLWVKGATTLELVAFQRRG